MTSNDEQLAQTADLTAEELAALQAEIEKRAAAKMDRIDPDWRLDRALRNIDRVLADEDQS